MSEPPNRQGRSEPVSEPANSFASDETDDTLRAKEQRTLPVGSRTAFTHWFGFRQFPDNLESLYKQAHRENAHERFPLLDTIVFPLGICGVWASCFEQVFVVDTLDIAELAFPAARLLTYVLWICIMRRPKSKNDMALQSLRLLYWTMCFVSILSSGFSHGDLNASCVFVVCDVAVGTTLVTTVSENLLPVLAPWVHAVVALLNGSKLSAEELILPLVISGAATVSVLRIQAARRVRWILHHNPGVEKATRNETLDEAPGTIEREYYTGEQRESMAAMVRKEGMEMEHRAQRGQEEEGREHAGFEIWEEIGIGGSGHVFVGLCRESGEVVAMKRVNDNKATRRELTITRLLQHPNVIHLHAHFPQPPDLCILLEYCPGGCLWSFLRRNGPLREPTARVLSRDMVEGVAYLHRHGFAHRDIKPGNLLLDGAGVLKVGDLGCTQSVGDRAEVRCITPAYAAPESLRPHADLRLMDIWAVGCTLVEMLTGTVPRFKMAPMADYDYLDYISKATADPVLPDTLSPLAHSAAARCLCAKPLLRIRALELTEHPFIAIRAGSAVMKPGEEEALRHKLAHKAQTTTHGWAAGPESRTVWLSKAEGRGDLLHRIRLALCRWEGAFMVAEVEECFQRERAIVGLLAFQKIAQVVQPLLTIRNIFFPFVFSGEPQGKLELAAHLAAGTHGLWMAYVVKIEGENERAALWVARSVIWVFRVLWVVIFFMPFHDDQACAMVLVTFALGTAMCDHVAEPQIEATLFAAFRVCLVVREHLADVAFDSWTSFFMMRKEKVVALEGAFRRLTLLMLVTGLGFVLSKRWRADDRKRFLDRI